MRDGLHTRARRVRARASVRAWEYRQRNHSNGVWFRLRRVLADAESAFAIPCSAVERLEREGFRRESVGTEIEPQKVILFVPAARLEEIPEKRPLRSPWMRTSLRRPASLSAAFIAPDPTGRDPRAGSKGLAGGSIPFPSRCTFARTRWSFHRERA